jgi:cell wall assembly regulator SMI1
MARDQAGNVVLEDVRPQPDGTWGVTVWFGSHPATYVQRYYYKTLQQARDSDIGDDVGKHGRVR